MVAETLLSPPPPPPEAPPAAAKKGSKGKKAEQAAPPEPPAAGALSYRASLLGCLGALDPGLSCGVASVLIAAQLNRHVEEGVLEAAGVLSARRAKRRALIRALTESGEGAAEELESGPDETLQALAAKLRATGLSPSAPAAGSGGSAGSAGAAARRELADCVLRALADDRPQPPLQVVQYCAKFLRELLLAGAGEAAELSAEQRSLLQGLADAGGAALARELAGPWADALPVLCHAQWRWGVRAVESAPLGDEAVASAVAARRASGGSASSQSADRPFPDSSTGIPPPPGHPPPQTAPFAERALGSVRAWAAARCLQRLLLGQPLDAPPAAAPPPDGYAQFTEEVREGVLLPLPDDDRGLPCRVAFERGKERSVYLSVAVAQLDSPGAAAQPPAAAAQQQQPEGSGGGYSGTVTATLLLTEPNPVALGTGVVRAVAPVAGATPYADRGHGKWLHVRVRSSLNALLTEVAAATPPPPGLPLVPSAGGPAGAGPGSLASARRLQDGHWTLSFPDEEACQVALALVRAHALRLQDVCEEMLAPMGVVPEGKLVGGGGGSGGGCGAGGQEEDKGEEGEDAKVGKGVKAGGGKKGGKGGGKK